VDGSRSSCGEGCVEKLSNPLTKAIPKMAKGPNDPALQAAFTEHLKETETQVKRLEQIAGLIETNPVVKSVWEWKG
jgi:ferritin-like metal-binding protein YciE